MLLVAEIQDLVAERFRIPRDEMTGPSRKREHARPRQMAMALAYEATRHGYSRLGDFFGERDHSTVIYALRVVEQRAEEDLEVRAAMSELRSQLMEKASG